MTPAVNWQSIFYNPSFVLCWQRNSPPPRFPEKTLWPPQKNPPGPPPSPPPAPNKLLLEIIKLQMTEFCFLVFCWRYCSLPFGPIIVTVFEEVDRHLTSRAPEKTRETKINWRQPNQTGQKAWLPIQDPCYISWSGSRPSSSKKYLWGETSRHKIDGYGFNHYG